MGKAIIPDEGMKRWSELSDGQPMSLSLRLFQNNFLPSKSSTLASFTQATYMGYTNQAMTNFGTVTMSGNVANSSAPSVTFTYSGLGTMNTIYGWYLVETTSGKVLAANDLPAPKLMQAPGDFITITLSKAVGDLP